MFAGAHQFRDLADMAEIVHGPFVERLLERDFAGLLVHGAALPRAARERPQIFHVGLALLFEVVEGVLSVRIAI